MSREWIVRDKMFVEVDQLYIDNQEYIYASGEGFEKIHMFTDLEQQNDAPMYPILCI